MGAGLSSAGPSSSRRPKRSNDLTEVQRKKKDEPTLPNPFGEESHVEMPQWAIATLLEIRENAIFRLGEDNSEKLKKELSSFTNKEDIHIALAVGLEKLVHWLKEYNCQKKLEHNLDIKGMMTKWLGDDVKDTEAKTFTVTVEEKENLMELILRQSELLMLYDLFIKGNCSKLGEEREVKERHRLPEVRSSGEGGGSASPRYELPRWAREELAAVIQEKELKTKDEEATAFLIPLLQLPKHIRKEETERRLEKGKKRILKYLKIMKNIRSADVVQPASNQPREINSEAMKAIIMNNRGKIIKNQFLKLFPDSIPNLITTEQQSAAEFKGKEDIKELLIRLEEERRDEIKFRLEEKVIRMDKKLQAYEEYLNSTSEVHEVVDHNPIPEFKIPEGKTDLDPEYYKIIEGRPLLINKFNKTEYLNTIKQIFMNNLTKNLAEDRATMVEERNMQQIDRLLKVLDEIDYYTEAFTLYLVEEEEQSMVSKRAYLDVGQLVLSKEAEIGEAQRIFTVLRASLFPPTGLLKFRRVCHELLLDLSPSLWRKEYDKEKAGLAEAGSSAADQLLAQLAVFKSCTPVQEPALEELGLFLADTLRNTGPPASFFSSGYQLDLAIRLIEMDHLHSFQHLALLITKNEEVESAKREFISSCACELRKIELLIERMRNQLDRKVEMIATLEKRCKAILNKYWRVVMKSEPLLEAINLINDMYEEFLGPSSREVGPLEKLDLLTEDIVKTQMELFELPQNATQEIRNQIVDKEEIGEELLLKDKSDFERTQRLLERMERSWGVTVGQQGHPVRFRSRPPNAQDIAERGGKKSSGLTDRLMARLLRSLEGGEEAAGGDRAALLDTLEALARIQAEDSGEWLAPRTSSTSSSPHSDMID